MGIYHSLQNPVTFDRNPYCKTLTSLYDLVELPNHKPNSAIFPSTYQILLKLVEI